LPRGPTPETESWAIMRETLGDFPESMFCCDPCLEDDYRARVSRGRQQMHACSAVLCGLARDVQHSLPSMSVRLERLGAMFADYRIVVFENDSRDGTLGFLWAWQQENSRVDVISELLGNRRWGQVCDLERAAKMAEYRNRYVAHAVDRYPNFDFLIAVDLDLPNGFSYDGVANTFGRTDWDAVGSNGVLYHGYGSYARTPMFFDAWAFRRVGDRRSRTFEEINRLCFRRGERLVPVWSSFGGLAVYRMAPFREGARYGGGDCEHVVLHGQLRERGFDRQFMNPSQIVLYSPHL
jgi:hypothetical protein